MSAPEGLRREIKINVPASELDAKVDEKLKDLSKQVRMPGFRPGKAPVKLLRKQYGKAAFGEVVSETVNEAMQKCMADNNLRPATEPDVDFGEPEEGKDLVCSVNFEVMPEFELGDFSTIELERATSGPEDEKVEEQLKAIAEQQKNFARIEEARPAQNGDSLLIDFVGRVDGTAFEGGAAEDYALEIGSGTFIPGFEEQLTGAAEGEKRDVTVTFPEDYGNAELAGKEAVFEVTVKEIRAPEAVELNDDFAQKLGLQSLDELRDMVRQQMQGEFDRASRFMVKRKLLDALAERYDFAVPAGMLQGEFDQIWGQVAPDEAALEAEKEKTGKGEDELKDEYRAIAERRVRLGLVLAEVGRFNNIQVQQDELQRALLDEARRYPGQEQQVLQFYQQNPEMMQRLRAPIYEDKVVDFVLEMAKVNEKSLPAQEFMALAEAEDEEDGHDHHHHDHDHHHHDHDHDHDHDHSHDHAGHKEA
ncbi:trigger factor [Marinibaculum pumilum]|uniref:Trigger factor n=1 Tax=Marinibaculum pumilum TaxID=1766165 RepID=A0ABV7KUQ2_9PROT